MCNSKMERNMRRLMENNCALILIFSIHVVLIIYCAVADRKEQIASNSKRILCVKAINKILKTWKEVKRKTEIVHFSESTYYTQCVVCTACNLQFGLVLTIKSVGIM
jgi:hypothetical protein